MASSSIGRSSRLTGTLIGAAIAAVLFAVVVVAAKPAEVWRLFQTMDGGLLAMAAATSVAFLSTRGLRLLLLVERGLLTWPRATLVAAAAQAAALFVPARTGELALPLLLARTTGRSFTAGVGTLFATRALDLATLGVWSGAAVLAVRGFREPLAIVVSLALFLPSLLLPFSVAVADRLALRCFAPRGMRGRRWARQVRRVRRELDGLLRRPLRLIAAVLTSIVMWGLQWAVAWILLVAMGHRWPPKPRHPRGRLDSGIHCPWRAISGGRCDWCCRPPLGSDLCRDLWPSRLGGLDGEVREEIDRKNRRSRGSFQRFFFRNPKSDIRNLGSGRFVIPNSEIRIPNLSFT
jgi:hypothetical protein